MGRFFKCVFQLDAQRRRNELGEPVHFAVGNVHGAANVLDRSLGGHRSKSNNLRNVFAPVLLRHIFDQLATSPHAEVDVDVGHGNALGVQEALEEQVVLQRIDVSDAQGVADQAARRGTTPRPDRHVLRARVVYEIPNNQEVALVAHLLDHFNFGGQPAFVLGRGISQKALLRQALELRDAGGKSFAHNGFKIACRSMPFGNSEFRERIGDALDLDVAARSDVHSAAQRFRNFAEDLRHLYCTLEVELIGLELHPISVAHGLAGLDAEQHFLGMSVVVMEIVTIVSGHQRDARLFRETDQVAIHVFFDRQSLVLNFEEEIAFAENVAQAISIFARLIVFLIDDCFGHRSTEAG